MSERAETKDPTTSLGHYLAPLREHHRVVLLVTLVTVAVGLGVAVVGPRSYTATTSVLIYPVSADPTEALQATDRSDDMATELQIAQSRAVAEVTATELGMLGIDVSQQDAAADIGVTNPEDSRILNVSYRSSDPAVARVGSELATSAYLAYRSELNAASRHVARSAIDAEIAVLQDRLSAAEDRIDLTAAGSSARLVAEVEKTSITGELEAQQGALADLSTLSIDAATVFDTAQEPTSADGLSAIQILIGAVAGGLVLGVIAAWALAALGIEVDLERLQNVDKPSRRVRRADGDDEPEDADSPFDDSDNRDPLELLKALDAIEADPRIAIASSKQDDAGPVDEPEQNDEPPSFAELYPNDLFDANASATDIIDALDTPDPTTDPEPDGFAEVEVAVDVAVDPEVNVEAEVEAVAAVEAYVETAAPAVAAALALVDGASDDDVVDEGPAPVETAPLSADPFEAPVETAPLSADPFEAPVEAPSLTADPFEAPVETAALSADPFEAPAQPASLPPIALRGLASLDEPPTTDHCPTDDGTVDDEVVVNRPAEQLANRSEPTADPEEPAADEEPTPASEEPAQPADPSLTTGDPNELDPGPPSWDGPFVGPTTWEQLSAMAAAANEASDGPAPTPAVERRAVPELVAGNDVDGLFEQLGRLGSAGPVAVLSLSDRNPAAGLTAGFELADELRAVGAHVLLIDARIESPVLDTLFDDGPGSGLAQVMTGEVVLDQAVRSLSGLDGLDLLTVGTIDAETAGQLTGPGFQRLLSEARLNYHSIVVIGDTITATGPADVVDVERSRALAAAVDGLIVGTVDPVGTMASDELTTLLASFDAPTLQLITAPLAPAGGAVPEASSV